MIFRTFQLEIEELTLAHIKNMNQSKIVGKLIQEI